MTPLLFSATSVGFSKSANFLSLRCRCRRPLLYPDPTIYIGTEMTESSSGTVWSNDAWSHPWLPHSPNSTTSPPHPVPFRSSCEGGYNRQIRVEHLHRARTPNFHPTKRGTTFADFGFGAGPLLTRGRAKMNLDWGFFVPPTPSACWDNPPFLFGMDSGFLLSWCFFWGGVEFEISGTWGSDHGEDLMHGGSPQRGLFFPLAPAGRPGTALCDVVPGSSVFAGEEKVPVETRIAGWDDARERESPFLGNATRGCATTLGWGIALLFNLFVFPVRENKRKL
ncbi:hypothetical protein BDZ91DRAFT_760797 [Kalaharituber pfeilii]|nr:hypothetical protein BDZ91DRAFT_760797 [Kalaharituber pfeilii]